jgi:hypothetical protein
MIFGTWCDYDNSVIKARFSFILQHTSKSSYGGISRLAYKFYCKAHDKNTVENEQREQSDIDITLD